MLGPVAVLRAQPGNRFGALHRIGCQRSFRASNLFFHWKSKMRPTQPAQCLAGCASVCSAERK